MRRGNLKAAPNYTNAALVMGAVNLLWVFMVIWATLGFLAVLVTGFVLDKLIQWCARRRAGDTAGG
ncbi:hypothetical protein RA2_00856 [Roseovarius sp. A-2]|uniref:hypothetical protein n=1 Tax=Roseovarius sp. A-2 TaxID=1570360 RepID=UPI0009B52B15|nr:hypothetical protein [Roseovarius sp. A-2]GAW33811.1 hypothetical protein RA2_00856 [Roseovarius sp. A-2]